MTAYGFGMIQVAWDDLPNLWGLTKTLKNQWFCTTPFQKHCFSNGFQWFGIETIEKTMVL